MYGTWTESAGHGCRLRGRPAAPELPLRALRRAAGMLWAFRPRTWVDEREELVHLGHAADDHLRRSALAAGVDRRGAADLPDACRRLREVRACEHDDPVSAAVSGRPRRPALDVAGMARLQRQSW